MMILKNKLSGSASSAQQGLSDPTVVTDIPKRADAVFRWSTFYRISATTQPSGRVAKSVPCLAADSCLTAYPGVASSIPARSH